MSARLTLAVAALALAGCAGVSSDAPPVTPALRGNPSQLTAGRNVFVNRCIECHSLPRIREHDAADWPHIVDKMSARADLTPAEHQALITYILAARSTAQ